MFTVSTVSPFNCLYVQQSKLFSFQQFQPLIRFTPSIVSPFNCSTVQLFYPSKSLNLPTVHTFKRSTVQLFYRSTVPLLNRINQSTVHPLNRPTVQLFKYWNVLPFNRFNCSKVQHFQPLNRSTGSTPQQLQSETFDWGNIWGGKTFWSVEQSKGGTVERWNGGGGERLRMLNMMISETYEQWHIWSVERLGEKRQREFNLLSGRTVWRWNSWTLEQLRCITVKGVNAWKGWSC